MTVLYNTRTKEILGHFNLGYLVHGKPGRLDEGIVELEVIEEPAPVYDPSVQRLTSEWVVDISKGTYTLKWTVETKTEEEIIKESWLHPEFEYRIVAPIELIMDDIGIKMYGWFNINKLPVEKVGESVVHLYCNTILPQHQAVIAYLGGVITIEKLSDLLSAC